jgi:hypothetical protein
VRTPVALGLLAALLAAGFPVRASSAAFTARSANAGSTFTTAADWIAPVVTLTAPADGASLKTTSVTLSGGAGNAASDATTVTVKVYSGPADTGTPVVTRSVTRSTTTWSSTVTGLADGVYTAQASQSDSAGNTGTSATSTFTVDTTAPTRTSIGAFNGATAQGRLEPGDYIVYTYSEAIAPASILSGWSGAQTAVKVRFFNGTTDAFTVLDSASAANVKLDGGTTTTGGVTTGTGANYVTNTVTFDATMTQSADRRSFTIVLGAPSNTSRLVTTQSPAANMTWTPKAGPTDPAGNGLANTNPVTETDNDRDF